MENTTTPTELTLAKDEIISLAKNIKTQYLTFGEMLELRLEQVLFINDGLETYSLKDIISPKTINEVAVALHGLIVNMEDIKNLVIRIENQSPALNDTYGKYLELSENNTENADLDLLGANIIDMMQPYLKDTTDASNKIDILTETYAVEVQVKIETAINSLANANIYLEKLGAMEDELNKKEEEATDGTTK